MAKKQQRKKNKRNGSASFWVGFLKFLGFFILFGLLLLYWDSARLTKIITNARPVLELTPDIDEIVRLDGSVEGIAAVTDAGKLRNTYTLLQKETFYWGCSKSSCDYKRSEDRRPEVSGSFMISGVLVQAEWFRFYSDWLPLDFRTVDASQLSNIYEGGTSRPLLIESPKIRAYGYYAVSPGERITVIGRAKEGRLEPFTLPGKEEHNVILIGSNMERMLSEERESQLGFGIVSGIVLLFLLPTIIGWVRKLWRRFKPGR